MRPAPHLLLTQGFVDMVDVIAVNRLVPDPEQLQCVQLVTSSLFFATTQVAFKGLRQLNPKLSSTIRMDRLCTG
jgi:hypothetical protein